MSNYGQQPPPGGNPYGQPQPAGYGQQPNPYGPPQPYGRPGQQPQYGPPYQPYPNHPSRYGAAPDHGPQSQPNQGYGPPQTSPWQPSGMSESPQVVQRPVVVVTMDAVPNRTITGVIGEVLGVVARSRELPRELRTDNTLQDYATMLTRSRQEAVAQLTQMASRAGAQAVVGLRFDSSEITQTLSEIVAYGTAVTLAPLPEQADPDAGITDHDATEDAGREGADADAGQPPAADTSATDPAATSPGQWPPPQQWRP